MTQTFVLAWVVLGSLILAWSVATDARNRGASPWLWFILTLGFNVFGALAYMILRPTERFEAAAQTAEPVHEPVREPVPLAAGVGAATSMWESQTVATPPTRPMSRPRPEPFDESEPNGYGAVDDEGFADEHEIEYQPAPSSPTRIWLYVGTVVVLGLVIAAALLLWVTAPGASTAASPAARPTATAAVQPTPTVDAAAPLLAPTEPPASAPTAAPTATAVRQAASYEVQPGDTLTSIAEAKGITVQDLKQANNLPADDDTIQPGQKLKLPAGG